MKNIKINSRSLKKVNHQKMTISTHNPSNHYTGPSLTQIENAQKKLKPYIKHTPLWATSELDSLFKATEDTQIRLKLELWQNTGTFKIRAALLYMMQLTPDQQKKGVVAVSGGNHALAVSYAAKLFDTPATVIMPKTASPMRINLCNQYGATVILKEDIEQSFAEEQRFINKGLSRVHPFEGETVALGTGTLGLEMIKDWPECDAIITAVGGGGLAAGIANAIQQVKPACQIFGVEPTGANAMTQSLFLDHPIERITPNTIADSLAAPCALPYSYSLCKQHLTDIINVSEDDIKKAMTIFFENCKLAVEPAAATPLAALLGPLQSRLKNKRIALLVCGSNINLDIFNQKIAP
jgi:threonine dehydratase